MIFILGKEAMGAITTRLVCQPEWAHCNGGEGNGQLWQNLSRLIPQRDSDWRYKHWIARHKGFDTRIFG